MAGTAGACFIWVAGVAGAADVGCMHGADGGNAGCSTKKQCLVGTCSVAVVPLGTVLAALTLFMEVSLHVAVCGTIAGVYLIAVLWEDAYHSSRNPNLSKDVIGCNWLTSIQWHKCFAMFVSLCLSRFRACIDLLMDLWG